MKIAMIPEFIIVNFNFFFTFFVITELIFLPLSLDFNFEYQIFMYLN